MAPKKEWIEGGAESEGGRDRVGGRLFNHSLHIWKKFQQMHSLLISKY